MKIIKFVMVAISAVAFGLNTSIAQEESLHFEESYEVYVEQLQTFDLENGHSLRYVDRGDKSNPVILFLHGVPTSSWTFRKIYPALTANGFRVIAPDHLGFGASDKPREKSLYSIEKHSDRVAALLKSLEIETFHLVLHDVGGLIGWDLIENNKDSLSGLTILNTITSKDGWNAGYLARFQPAIKTKWMTKIMLCNMLEDNSYAKNKSIRYGYFLPLNEGANFAYFRFLKSIPQVKKNLPDLAELFSDIDIPISVVWGMKDGVLSGEKQIPIVASDLGIPEDQIHRVENVGHLIQEENPQAIIDAILQ